MAHGCRSWGALSFALALLACAPSQTSKTPVALPTHCPGEVQARAAGAEPRLVIQRGHAALVFRVAFHEQSGLLASGAGDGTLRIWQVARKALLAVIPAPGGQQEVSTFAWNRAGDALLVNASAQGRGRLGLRAVGGMSTSRGLPAQRTVDLPGTLPRVVVPLRGSEPGWLVLPLTLGSPGDASSGGAAWIVDEATLSARLLPRPAGLAADIRPTIRGFSVSADGKTLVASLVAPTTRSACVGGDPVGLAKWDLTSDSPPSRFVPFDRAGRVAVGPDGSWAVVSSAPCGAVEGDTELVFVALDGSGPPRTITTLPGRSFTVAVSGDGTLALASITPSTGGALVGPNAMQEIHAFDIATGRRVWRTPRPPGARLEYSRYHARRRSATLQASEYNGLASLAGTGMVIGVLTDGRMQLLDARTGRTQGELGRGVRAPHDLIFSGPDVLVSAHGHGLTSWDLQAGQVVHVERAEHVGTLGIDDRGEVRVSRHIESPAGNRGCGSGEQGFQFQRWRDHRLHEDANRVHCAVVSREAFEDVSASTQRVLAEAVDLETSHVLTDPTNGQRVELEVVPDSADLWEASFAARGMLVVSVTESAGTGESYRPSTAYLWDARTGALRHTLREPSTQRDVRGVSKIAVSGDGRYAAICFDEAVGVVDLRSGKRAFGIALGSPPEALAISDSDPPAVVVGYARGAVEIYQQDELLGRAPTVGGSVHRIVLARDGSRAAVVSADGGVRLFDMKTGMLQATLVDFDDDEHIAFTPSGAYRGTAEVADRVGWVFDEPFEYFSFEQFAGRYDKPEVVRSRLSGAVTDVAKWSHRPPKVAIREARLGAREAVLTVGYESPRRVDRVLAVVEGRPVADDRVCASGGTSQLKLPLLPGNNTVAVTAFDDRGVASNPVSTRLSVVDGSGRRPDIWVLALGVSRYPNLPPDRQLDLADDDAIAITDALRAHAGAGKTYRQAHVELLTDAQVTPDAVTTALRQLESMAAEDVAVVFLAGHGAKRSADGDMVFLTHQARLQRATLELHGIGWSSIAAALQRAKGRVLVLLDACHSGHVSRELVVPNDDLARELGRSGRGGVVVFAASKGRQLSYEGAPFQLESSRALLLRTGEQREAVVHPAGAHGFFTGALLKALGSVATDSDDDGALQLSELIEEVTRRVTFASGGRQTPWVVRRQMFGDFRVVELAPAPDSAWGGAAP